MSDDEPIDLADLSRQWKEIDMPVLKMTAETGRMQASAHTSVWLMRAILAGLGLCTGVMLFTGLGGSSAALAGALAYGAATIAFGVFARRQSREVTAADTLLAEGTPAQVLQARITLLDTELHAWTSTGSLLIERLGFPLVVLCATGLWWAGMMAGWVPASVAVFFAAFAAWGRVRVPRLRAQRAQADQMLQQL